MKSAAEQFTEIWGAYPNYDDIARLEYGRMMWRLPAMRARLLAHWADPRHPYRERFAERRALIEETLVSSDDAALQRKLLAAGSSLRCVAREIPPVFGSFWPADMARDVAAPRG